jgi:hypothetical protein
MDMPEEKRAIYVKRKYPEYPRKFPTINVHIFFPLRARRGARKISLKSK